MASKSRSSFFTYSVTRPFPTCWFTPVVVSGGLVLAVLFSFVAVASNAYELQTIYTSDPNTTETQRQWFEKTPFSWFNSLDTQCQSSVLTVGASYKTSNRGFVYTLSGIEADVARSGGVSILPSIAYKNASLQQCEVASIRIIFARDDQTPLAVNWWTWGATTASATVRCSLGTSSGQVSVNFTTALPSIDAEVGFGSLNNLLDNFVYQKDLGQLHMFYGINIAVLWYYVLGSAIGLSPPQDDTSWGRGLVQISRNSNTSDYTRSDFFYCHPRFTTNSGGLRNRPKPTYTFDDWKNQVPPDKPALPDISMTVDAFSKSYYSILLSDFGVLDFTNAFATVPGIEYIQSRQDTDLAAAAEEFHFDIADEHLKTGRIAPVLQPGQNPILYNMTAGPTTVYTQYLCSVPKRKSGMSLIFPVLIADIVFLQAVWKLFILITTWWLGRTDKQMNYCAGCLETKRAGDLAVDAFDTRPPHSRRYSERSELQELIPMRSYGR